MQVIYHPKADGNLWKRLQVAWRILWHKDYFPQPLDWYERLYWQVSSEYSRFAEMAVDKAEREFQHTAGTQDLRRKEALQWLYHYARAEKKSTEINPNMASFLVEWWVARRKGCF